MCPQQQRRMLNSLLLTSLGVNSHNPVIDQFFTSLADRPSAYKFCLLGKFDILSPDEIDSLAEKLVTLLQDDIGHRFAEKLVTLLQDDIGHRFSNDLLQFVDYSNEFLGYAEYTIYI